MCCVWVYWTTDHLRGTKQGISAAVETRNCRDVELYADSYQLPAWYLSCGEGMNVKFTCRNFLSYPSLWWFLFYNMWCG